MMATPRIVALARIAWPATLLTTLPAAFVAACLAASLPAAAQDWPTQDREDHRAVRRRLDARPGRAHDRRSPAAEARPDLHRREQAGRERQYRHRRRRQGRARRLHASASASAARSPSTRCCSRKLPYDPAKDIALITMLATQPSALAVNAEPRRQQRRRTRRAAQKRTPANTISARSATARCRISPWRRSRSRAAPDGAHSLRRARRRR